MSREYNYFNNEDADKIIDAVSRSVDLRLNLDIVNFSFAPVAYILNQLTGRGCQLERIELTAHRYCDLEEKDSIRELAEFSYALGKQTGLTEFRYTQKKQESREINDGIVRNLCQGLFHCRGLKLLSFRNLVSDTSAEKVVSLVKDLPKINSLLLNRNSLSNKGATELIELAHYNRFLFFIDLRGNALTEQLINTLLDAPQGCSIQINLDPITPANQQLLAQRDYHYNDHKNLVNFGLVKRPLRARMGVQEAKSVSNALSALLKILQSAPECQYRDNQKSEFEFSQAPTQQLSLPQLLRGDSRMWEKPNEEDETATKIHKDIVICAYNAILHNFIFSSSVPFAGILFWNGDPLNFGSICRNQYFNPAHPFVPAVAADVERLLEQARPAEAHRYWVIDETRWRKTIRATAVENPVIRDYFDFFHTGKEIDLSPYAFYMTDGLFQKIARGIAKTTTQIDLSHCRHLSPKIVIQVLHQFPHLKFLGLRQTQPWGEELKMLAQICPDLEELEMGIDTVAPLKNLARFRRLRRLYLDLSDNFQLKNLDFLQDFGPKVTLLKLSDCHKLTDLTGLKYCVNLEEIWFENMSFVDINGLIQQLGQLKRLKLWAFPQCELVLNEKQNKLIREYLPEVTICNTTIYASLKGKNLSDEAILVQNNGPGKFSTVGCREEKCDFSYVEPSKRRLTVSQVFWDSQGQWPDSRLDRYSTLDILKIKDDGHIVFAASPVEQLKLKICEKVQLIPYEAINVQQLQSIESRISKLQNRWHYYAGQLVLTVSANQWIPIPSREVISRPIASSEDLLWAYSLVTGELLVRLPEKTKQARTQKIKLRYIIAATKQTGELQAESESKQTLPDVIRQAFTALSKDSKILENFPHFKAFITQMQSIQDGQSRYAQIKQYCQIEPEFGFSDAPFDEKDRQIVAQFVETLELKNPNTQTDLVALFNGLLQQKGVCKDITCCAKLLCDYYAEITCYIGKSQSHAFLIRAYREKGKLVTGVDDLGGGDAHVTECPLTHLTEEIKARTPLPKKTTSNSDIKFRSDHLERNKFQIVKQALADYKAVIPDGEKCRTLTEYWRTVLSRPHPLIYLPKSVDAQQMMTALRQYALAQTLTPQQLFYINDPKQLSDWWEAIRVEKDDPQRVPGWLPQFLLEETPRILVMDVREFAPYDLTAHQGIGDQQRTLQTLILPESVQIICLAAPELAQDENADIFLSRFTPLVHRADLWAEVKSIPSVWPLPTEEKIPIENVMHLYGDSLHAADCLGVPTLEGSSLTFVPGPLARAMTEKHDLLLTDIPPRLHPLLFLTALTEQTLVNGVPQAYSDIKIYAGQHAQPDSVYIQFVEELKSGVSRYYLNPHSYPYLVNGDRRIDPDTGYSHSRPALLLTEELPGVIAVTRSLSFADWCRLVDRVNQRQKTVSFYLCPGVKIAGTSYAAAPAKSHPSEEFKTLPDGNSVIESAAPEQSLADLLKHSDVGAEDVLTLTANVGLELLALVSRKGDRFLLNYQPGWLLSRLRAGKTTILMGEMSSLLYHALESLFSMPAHLYTNEGRETVSGRVIWIRSSAKPKAFPPTVSRYRHPAELEMMWEEKTSKTTPTTAYSEKVNEIRAFIEDPGREAVFLELLGPPGSGKTTAVTQAVSTLQTSGQSIPHFSTVDDYIAWRKDHIDDAKTVCVLQLDDCRLSPPGHLEFLRDIARQNQFYWQGVWYPGLKIILTNNPESDPRHDKHALFTDYSIPALSFTPFTWEELGEYILKPQLKKIEVMSDHVELYSQLILAAYQYVTEALPYACISVRELKSVCQRLAVLRRLYPEEKPMSVCTRAAYEEFFGLFPDENPRQQFSGLLQEFAQRISETEWEELITVDPVLKAAVQKRGLQLTPQGDDMVAMIQRLLQMREQQDSKACVDKGGLLFEGPPGILKTELSIAVLEAQGITACPTVLDGKLHYFNLVAGDPALMEKQLLLAYSSGWIVVCNELNLLKPETIQLLMKLLEAPNTGFRLIATQNNTAAGGGRKPLLPALKNRLQVFYLRDYARHELMSFAQKQGLQNGALLADMYQALRDYQTQHQLAVANPRHYFRWLAELAKLPAQNRSVAVVARHLLKSACNPLFSPQSTAIPGQRHAVDYILQHVPARRFPKTAPSLSWVDQLMLIKSPSEQKLRTPPSSSSDKDCLIM